MQLPICAYASVGTIVVEYGFPLQGAHIQTLGETRGGPWKGAWGTLQRAGPTRFTQGGGILRWPIDTGGTELRLPTNDGVPRSGYVNTVWRGGFPFGSMWCFFTAPLG